MSNLIFCSKLKQELEPLHSPPFPGEMGNKIFAHISKKAWGMWITHQTMLINEYRLNLADPESRKFLTAEMDKFLFGEGSEKPQGFVDPNDHSSI